MAAYLYSLTALTHAWPSRVNDELCAIAQHAQYNDLDSYFQDNAADVLLLSTIAAIDSEFIAGLREAAE